MDEPVAFYDYLPKRGVEELKGKIAGFGDFQVPLRQFRGRDPQSRRRLAVRHRLVFLLAIAVLAAAQSGIASELPASQNAAPQRPPLLGGSTRRSDSNFAAESTTGAGGSSFLGKDVPFLDAGSNAVRWDGKSWNIRDNALFAARFEKYLNAPAATKKLDDEYQTLLQEIMAKLSPGNITPRASDEAFQLLARASRYEEDTNLCDTIANQVYSAWLARRNIDRLKAASKVLEDERNRLEWNAQLTAKGNPLAPDGSAKSEEVRPILARLLEIKSLIRSNLLKREVAEIRAKIEFQALIMQHFFQRRFQHVVIGTRFYRSIFTDGDSRLWLGKNSNSYFPKTGDLTPTLATIDSFANEIMSDVREGVQAFKFLLERKELDSARKRLSEAFMLGEYLPDIRALHRDDKRQVLVFIQKSNQLITLVEAKDFTRAEELLSELTETAKDLDASEPAAVIENAKRLSATHIAKARNALLSGDANSFETELQTAAEIWPCNPALSKFCEVIFSNAFVQSQAMSEFDNLLSQKNYRQIFDDGTRFIAATAMFPEKQQKLREVLENMEEIESAILRARQSEEHGDYAAAWESAEKVARNIPRGQKVK